MKESKNLKSWSKKLIDVCRNNLTEIIKFNANETSFLTNIIDHGEITPELITQDKSLIELIKVHPVLLWKAVNVKEYKRQ